MFPLSSSLVAHIQNVAIFLFLIIFFLNLRSDCTVISVSVSFSRLEAEINILLQFFEIYEVDPMIFVKIMLVYKVYLRYAIVVEKDVK